METTTIRVYPKTKSRLDEAGRKGQTYDEIINATLDAVTSKIEVQQR